MMPDISIDFAQAADLDAMIRLLGELFAQEHDFRPDPEKQRRGLQMILDHPARGRLFVLRAGGQVVGMVNALITISTAEGAPVVLLEDLIIDSRHRGLGHGKRLLAHLVAWARAAGMARISLLTDGDNARAQAMYGSFGFVASDMRLMRRSL